MTKLTGSLGVRNEINVDIIGTGARGKEGKSAYEIWLDLGNEGTEQEYLASLKGEKGDKGDAAIVSVGAVTTGEAGTDASVENVGTSSAAVFNFVIPRGDKGERGEQGIQGVPGENGTPGADGQDGAPGTPGKDGAPGAPGKDGEPGVNGQDGHTPVKGVDYWTDTDKAEIVAEVTAASQPLEKSIETYYALRRTGKVYQTKLWKFAANPTSAGIKLLDNAGLNFTPSTDTVEGADDYASIPLFDWVNVNYARDADGTPRPIAIEGMNGYQTTGAVDVGTMQMSFWWRWDSSHPEYDLVTISDTPHPELSLSAWPECVAADGTVMPWCIASKYFSGKANDGKLRSQPNLPIANFQSHNTMVSEYPKKGAGYWGAGAIRNTFQIVFNAIKGGTKSSQTRFAGCISHDAQRKVARAEAGVRRVLLTTAQGAAFVIGSTVSIGDPAENTILGRGQSYMRNIADLVRIASIDTVTIDGADYAALNLELAADITTTATTYVSTMPWHAGSTDAVKGRHDGSPGSNADGKHVYRVQGREYAPGAYFVGSDTVMDVQPDFSKNVYVAQKGTPHSVADATIKNTYKLIGNIHAEAAGADYWVGDVALDAETGAWYPSAVGASSAQGMGDRLYAGGTATSGTREYLQGGDLGVGWGAGSAVLYCWYNLVGASWNCAGCD